MINKPQVTPPAERQKNQGWRTDEPAGTETECVGTINTKARFGRDLMIFVLRHRAYGERTYSVQFTLLEPSQVIRFDAEDIAKIQEFIDADQARCALNGDDEKIEDEWRKLREIKNTQSREVREVLEQYAEALRAAPLTDSKLVLAQERMSARGGGGGK